MTRSPLVSHYPDYGTPGAPNLDPYYQSPAQVAAAEAEAEDAHRLVEDAEEEIAGILEDLESGLKKRGMVLKSVTIDVGNLGVTIETRAG